MAKEVVQSSKWPEIRHVSLAFESAYGVSRLWQISEAPRANYTTKIVDKSWKIHISSGSMSHLRCIMKSKIVEHDWCVLVMYTKIRSYSVNWQLKIVSFFNRTFIARWTVPGALFNPKGIRMRQQKSEWEEKVDLPRSFSAFSTCQYPLFQSGVENIVASPMEWIHSFMLDIRYRSQAFVTFILR